MRHDPQGRQRKRLNTLPLTGPDGIGVVEGPDTVALALDVNSLAEDTAPAATDFLVIYDVADAEHKRLPLSAFLSFPPVNANLVVYRVEQDGEPTIVSWGKQAGAQFVLGILIGAGGAGGSSAHAGGTIRHSGGGGGGGGAYEATPMMPADLFLANGALRVGSCGYRSPAAIGTNVNGSNGVAGFSSIAAILTSGVEITAGGGGGGIGGTTTSTASGGGSGGTATVNGGAGGDGGQGDSNANSPAGLAGGIGAAPGGGGGGGINTGGGVFAPGAGGLRTSNRNLTGATAGTSSTTGNGTTGAAGAAAFPPMLSGGMSGAGGGSTSSANAFAGDGGRGGLPGGGGGGGGAGTNGTGSAGDGGRGGDGLIAIIQFR